MKRKALTLIILASAFISMTGCSLGNIRIGISSGNNTTGQTITTSAPTGTETDDGSDTKADGPVLSVKINKSAPVDTAFDDLNVGDEIYNGFGSTIKIKSVNEKEITFDVDGCLVEPNNDGTINLRKEPIKKFTLKKGKSIDLASQTMDAGVRLSIEYK